MLNGASMSGPYVSGAATVLRQRHPTWSPMQVERALVLTASDDDIVRCFEDAQRELPSGRLDYLAGSIRAERDDPLVVITRGGRVPNLGDWTPTNEVCATFSRGLRLRLCGTSPSDSPRANLVPARGTVGRPASSTSRVRATAPAGGVATRLVGTLRVNANDASQLTRQIPIMRDVTP
jgi:subtilisin family serine protease